MHLLVTDVLACPRCGPDQGMILLADRIEDRRVDRGRLGCSNCRQTFPIEAGVADFRGTEVSRSARPRPHDAFVGEPEEVALRLAALVGLSDAPALVLAEGVEPAVIDAACGIVPSVEWLVPLRGAADPPAHGSALRIAGPVPLKPRSVHGAALPFPASESRIRAVAACVAPGGRLVACPADPALRERIGEDGFDILLFEDGVLVAERRSRPARPLHQLDTAAT